MDSCYYYREYKLPKGNLDSTVDCTYVLIMHDSPREDQIYQHIMKAEPTSRVFFNTILVTKSVISHCARINQILI